MMAETVTFQFYLFLVYLGGAAALGVLIGYLFTQNKIKKLEQENIQINTTLELERKSTEEKISAFQQATQQLTDTFGALSSKALRENNEAFLKLAQQNLEKYQNQATNELDKKEKAIENMVKPIQEALSKTEDQIRHMEKERKEAYGSLHKHLETMATTQANLHNETRNLVQALRRPEVRGQWGELTLKRLAELAGMVEHCDFYEQENIDTEQGRQRPDMIVRMPDGRMIVVDVKTPLDAYLNAIEATDDAIREQEMLRHTRNVKNRINELSNKAYWSQFDKSPDFVVLFIPGDQFLSAALDNDRNLIEDALTKQVVLATPTSLVALLRAVAYGWRQEQLAENAEIIREVGEELYQRLATFTTHLQKMGKALDSSMKAYNSAVGSFDSRVLPGAQKFTELGISEKKTIEDLQQIETGLRQIQNTSND